MKVEHKPEEDTVYYHMAGSVRESKENFVYCIELLVINDNAKSCFPPFLLYFPFSFPHFPINTFFFHNLIVQTHSYFLPRHLPFCTYLNICFPFPSFLPLSHLSSLLTHLLHGRLRVVGVDRRLPSVPFSLDVCL